MPQAVTNLEAIAAASVGGRGGRDFSYVAEPPPRVRTNRRRANLPDDRLAGPDARRTGLMGVIELPVQRRQS